jgi:hypothetical protein
MLFSTAVTVTYLALMMKIRHLHRKPREDLRNNKKHTFAKGQMNQLISSIRMPSHTFHHSNQLVRMRSYVVEPKRHPEHQPSNPVKTAA